MRNVLHKISYMHAYHNIYPYLKIFVQVYVLQYDLWVGPTSLSIIVHIIVWKMITNKGQKKIYIYIEEITQVPFVHRKGAWWIGERRDNRSSAAGDSSRRRYESSFDSPSPPCSSWASRAASSGGRPTTSRSSPARRRRRRRERAKGAEESRPNIRRWYRDFEGLDCLLQRGSHSHLHCYCSCSLCSHRWMDPGEPSQPLVTSPFLSRSLSLSLVRYVFTGDVHVKR